MWGYTFIIKHLHAEASGCNRWPVASCWSPCLSERVAEATLAMSDWSSSAVGPNTGAPHLRFCSGKRNRQRRRLPLYLLTCFTSLGPDAFIWACSVLRVSRHLHYSWLSYTHGKSLPARSEICSPFTSPSILSKHLLVTLTVLAVSRVFVFFWVCVVGFRIN